MDKNVFLFFVGSFLIILQDDTLLLHMLKIKGKNFELQDLQQFATAQNLLCKLQMIVFNDIKLELFASICVCDLQAQIYAMLNF